MLIIGDVHGCEETLKALLAKIPKKHKKQVCLAGDLIDRGPKSREVIQMAIDEGFYCVMGNHDEWMAFLGEKTLKNMERGAPWMNDVWFLNGGHQTIDSYRDIVEVNGEYEEVFDKEIYLKHVEFIKKLPVYLHFSDIKNPDGKELVVSHSVILNNWKSIQKNGLKEKDKEIIIWSRPDKIKNIKDNIYNVIGHTPNKDNPRIKKTYANLDTGCFIGLPSRQRHLTPRLGKLTALHFETMTVYQQDCIDKCKNYLREYE